MCRANEHQPCDLYGVMLLEKDPSVNASGRHDRVIQYGAIGGVESGIPTSEENPEGKVKEDGLAFTPYSCDLSWFRTALHYHFVSF